MPEAGAYKGLPNQTGPSSRRGSVVREAQGREPGGGERAEAGTGARLGEQARRRLHDPLPASEVLLPEPEGPAATTRDSLTGRRVPTSDSAGQPELTSPRGAGPCGGGLRRKQSVPPPRAPARKHAQGAGATCPGGAGPGSGVGGGGRERGGAWGGAWGGAVRLGGAVWDWVKPCVARRCDLVIPALPQFLWASASYVSYRS